MVKKSLSVTLVCTYRPPGNVSAAFCTELSALLDHLLASGRRFAICGDFNYPGKDEGSLDDDLMDMLGSHNLMQHVSESTHNDGNILDLVITLSAESRVSQFSTQPAFFSDHKLVLYRLHMPRPEPVVVTRTYRDIRKIDMESFQRDVLSSALYTDDISPSKTEVLLCSSGRRQHQIPTTAIRICSTFVQPAMFETMVCS